MDSVHLLKSIHIKNAGLAGDTRFDRVAELPKQRRDVPVVEEFIAGCANVLVAGSTWPEDERLIAECFLKHPDWKIVLAPHEVSDFHLQQIKQIFPKAIFYSSFSEYSERAKEAAQILIIDNIGMLSSLYAYGKIAYVGGGFGAGIHNTLEAATYGLPVVFGPRYSRFQEAVDLIELGAGFSITKSTQLEELLTVFAVDQKYAYAAERARAYVQEKSGATPIIMKYLQSQKLLND